MYSLGTYIEGITVEVKAYINTLKVVGSLSM